MRQRPPELVAKRDELVALLADERRGARSIALVPTMGALHPGHLALIEAARAAHDLVVCSIFVNALQFDDPADLARYPHQLEADLALAAGVGADVVFAPPPEALHLSGPPEVTVDPGRLGDLLEGERRPGHLRGVATVVAALFALVWPHAAYFGEKDYQQLLLVRRLRDDLGFPLEIVAVATRREEDGLALSSRNARLSPDERHAATVLHRALCVGRDLLAGGASPGEAEVAMARLIEDEPLATLDYAVVRSAADLEAPPEEGAGDLRLLVAVRIGATRLIDNCGVVRGVRR